MSPYSLKSPNVRKTNATLQNSNSCVLTKDGISNNRSTRKPTNKANVQGNYYYLVSPQPGSQLHRGEKSTSHHQQRHHRHQHYHRQPLTVLNEIERLAPFAPH